MRELLIASADQVGTRATEKPAQSIVDAYIPTFGVTQGHAERRHFKRDIEIALGLAEQVAPRDLASDTDDVAARAVGRRHDRHGERDAVLPPRPEPNDTVRSRRLPQRRAQRRLLGKPARQAGAVHRLAVGGE
jgi:hypothetical protein